MDNRSSGLGLADVLAIVFIVLKLVGVITWSWIWVLSPIWISFLLLMLLDAILSENTGLLWLSAIIILAIVICIIMC